MRLRRDGRTQQASHAVPHLWHAGVLRRPRPWRGGRSVTEVLRDLAACKLKDMSFQVAAAFASELAKEVILAPSQFHPDACSVLEEAGEDAGGYRILIPPVKVAVAKAAQSATKGQLLRFLTEYVADNMRQHEAPLPGLLGPARTCGA